MNKLRILLGDDHLLLRHGLRRILQERPDWEVVGEASDGREALSKLINKESTPLEAWAGEGFIELRLEKRRS